MSRQRRRRVGEGEEGSLGRQEGSAEEQARENNQRAPMFMEAVDYKMEMGQEEEGKLVLLKNEAFTEEEKREAFKKKLKKHSGSTTPDQLDQNP